MEIVISRESELASAWDRALQRRKKAFNEFALARREFDLASEEECKAWKALADQRATEASAGPKGDD